MTAALPPRETGASGGVGGPVTGIIEMGNGTQSTRVEFDIPIGPYLGNPRAVLAGSEPQDSGAVVQVPTGIVRAYARYDNAYVTPDINGYAFGGPGSPAFPLFPGAGPFAPNLGTPIPLNVKAYAAYYGRHFSRLYKTQYLYVGNATTPVSFTSIGIGPTYAIPAFAKSVQVIPVPAVSLTIQLIDTIPYGSNAANKSPFVERYVITAGTYPVFAIAGNDNHHHPQQYHRRRHRVSRQARLRDRVLSDATRRGRRTGRRSGGTRNPPNLHC